MQLNNPKYLFYQQETTKILQTSFIKADTETREKTEFQISID